MKKGDPFGTHRVIAPKGTLPQPAVKLNNNFKETFDNEILCSVKTLNIDSASFVEIKKRAGNNTDKIIRIMAEIVEQAGKHKNPWTGSGGMFIGEVKKIGPALRGTINLCPGDKIASLVSLSLTPLKIEKIINVNKETGHVDILGEAVLFESGVWAKLPENLPLSLSLSVLDVAGAPAQADRLVSRGDIVAVLGAAGKSGLLCCYQAKKRAGKKGRVIAVIHSSKHVDELKGADFIDEVIVASADNAPLLFEKVKKATDSLLCDIVINCVSRPDCEMGSIMITKERGKICFFSMATSFTKAALGAEGIGKDVDMIIGNGYLRGHAKLSLGIMEKSRYLKDLFQKRYA
ncbi:MAG: L-erythro-3,5-diaminohexanoate dehydrogenase [Nitrospinota bacterium]